MKNRVNDDRFHSCTPTPSTSTSTNTSIVTGRAGNMQHVTADRESANTQPASDATSRNNTVVPL